MVFKRTRELVQGSLEFVSAEATLGDAKAAMEKKPKCQDVFVTETGQPDDSVLGWLTNIEISRHTKA
jgi:hypothetical protein